MRAACANDANMTAELGDGVLGWQRRGAEASQAGSLYGAGWSHCVTARGGVEGCVSNWPRQTSARLGSCGGFTTRGDVNSLPRRQFEEMGENVPGGISYTLKPLLT